ncbi:DNA/RNA non-specific endonuclease [Lapidilactobacillus wuchangensis]|uniref:DNA/RNA non-specific endonuclease n=1 Tax=Lapidilactobacillus wuchangensis TaxID=2486001 RepID=UPI000F7BB05F|nr:DNA/RNA non-specific endonuclease [Lapidilactobacillus wuchangensis]
MAKKRTRRRSRPRRKQLSLTSAIAILIIGALVWLARDPNSNQQSTAGSSSVTTTQQQATDRSALTSSAVSAQAPTTNGQTKAQQTTVQADQLTQQTYQDRQIIAVNQNKPTFSSADLSLSRGTWQDYHALDQYNRVVQANALMQRSSMPTAKRERLYVQPTGWHNRKITINGKQDYLYNRCHLIGYQLTGQNNNPKNLMTGTRSLNDPAMTYYENAMASYLKTTNHHVRYQVTPIFVGSELVARGIHMMGQSVEDNQISFNIYIFNVQANYQINYQDGTSKAA